MERRPNNPNFSEYEQFASNLYDDVDRLFAKRDIPSLYEHVDKRYSELQLTEDELQDIAPVLQSYAIDPPHSVEIKLQGGNPYHSDAPIGVLWITTKHNSLEKDVITSEYTVWIDPSEKQPINACKDVRREVAHRGPNEWGILSLPIDLSDVYFNMAPIGNTEQRALRAMIGILQQI